MTTSNDFQVRGGSLSVALAAGAALMAGVLALAADTVSLAPAHKLLSLGDLSRVSWLRDLLAEAVLGVAAMGALGRSTAVASVPSARLERLGHLVVVSAAGGVLALLCAAPSGDRPAVVLTACALALLAIAGTLDAIGALVRTRGAVGDGFAVYSVRTAAIAALAALPVVGALASLVIAEQLTGEALWRGEASNLDLAIASLRSCARPFVPLALLAATGGLLDALATIGGRPAALGGACGALRALALFGLAAWAGELLGASTPAGAAIASFFSLAILAPFAVLCAEGLSSLWLGTLGARPVSLTALAAAACLVERVAVGLPLGLADGGALLRGSALAAVGRELELAALGFLLAGLTARVWPALRPEPSRARVLTGAAFAGVQLAALAHLSVARWPRGVPSSSLQLAELVALVGASLAALTLAGAGAGAARTLRRRTVVPEPSSSSWS